VEALGDLEAEAVERLALEDALARLSARDRDLLALRYGADLRARQIAELFGSTTNAVEVALHRALARLRGELEAGQGSIESAPALDASEERV
jgi:RNA polymerase sigma-70 factor (ECF subfamily)